MKRLLLKTRNDYELSRCKCSATGRSDSVSFALVLPKYEVKVHLPSVITVLDQEAALKICGK